MSGYGYDENGVYRQLDGGRVLRINVRMYNTLLTVSSSHTDSTWIDGW